jgi:hypothetical protein
VTDERVAKLAAALKTSAQVEWTGAAAESAEGWRDLTRTAFADAGIQLTDEQFTRAWRATRQCAFYGGNFTLDARRILRAVDGT